MSFDDSTGALDRAHYASTVGIWGDSLGDRSIQSLWESQLANREFAKVESADQAVWRARQARKVARLEADAQRRRSKPVEDRIKAERLANSKTAMGAAFRKAFAKQRD
jgi:hypothetical protein